MGDLVKETCPMVSVVIPVYNVEPWLRECLDSVIGQTLKALEIICVNDGSTDGSAKILSEYEKKDARIRVLSQENKGLSETRNTGARAARGKYLYFMDSDDLLVPDAMECCAARMERDGLDFLSMNAVAFGEGKESAKAAGNKNRSYYRRFLHEDKIYTGAELYQELREEDQYNSSACLCVTKRESFIQSGLWFHPGILHEDEPWMFNLLFSLQRCGCLNRNMYHRRIREGSITTQGQTFAHVYGKFIGAEDMQRTLERHPEILSNPRLAELSINHVLIIQKAASKTYLGCEEAEKQKYFGLNLKERILFERVILSTAALMEEKETIQQNRNDLLKRNEALQKDVHTLNTKNAQLVQDMDAMKSSLSWRVGKTITFVPGKMKSLLRSPRIPASTSDMRMKEAEPQQDVSVIQGKAQLFSSIQPSKVVWLLGTPEHGNMGDHFIAMAEKSFLQSMLPGCDIREITEKELIKTKYEALKQILPGQLVFFQGGGAIGNLWPLHDEVRGEVLRRIQNRPMLIFPQSICFTEDESGQAALRYAKTVYCGDEIILCCREEPSFSFAKKQFPCPSLLVPDIVLWDKRLPKQQLERFGALTLFRKDREQKLTETEKNIIEEALASRFCAVETGDTVLSTSVNPEQREEKAEKMLRQIASAECVVTDRLHGMILCAITETPCVVLGNGYYKVEGSYEWLKDLGYIQFIHTTDQLEQAINKVCSCKERNYPEKEIQKLFEPLISLFRQR